MLKQPLALLFAAAISYGYPNGSRVPTGNAGEPGTGTPCAACHSVTLNPTGGSVTLTGPTASYTPGVTQRWTLTVADPNSAYRKGFQLTATAGTFTAVTSTLVMTGSANKQYVTHTTSAASYVFDFTPPSGSDPITVYMAGAAASGTRSTDVYTKSLTLTPAASQAKPAISFTGVVNAASFAATISPGSWVTIFGSNLAPAGVARGWTAADIGGTQLPTSLEGTKVRINGKAAAIAYVSATQLNVQAPDDTATGAVNVEVETAAGGTSAASTVELRAVMPALFRFAPNGSRYAAAVHADGSLAGPAQLFGTAVTTKPAQPGETILLFGTGFGATNPVVPAGIALSGAAPLAAGNGLEIRIGGVAAEVAFAGLSATGLYQFNVVVPTALANGDQLLEVSVQGVSSGVAQYLAVAR